MAEINLDLSRLWSDSLPGLTDEAEKGEAKPKVKVPEKHELYYTVLVTPQMLVAALKRLQFRYTSVNINDIIRYLSSLFPLRNTKERLFEEVELKLIVAVQIGFVIMCPYGYRLPFLRENSFLSEEAVTAFWKLYKEMAASNTYKRMEEYRKPEQTQDDTSISTLSVYSDTSKESVPVIYHRRWSVDTYNSIPSQDDEDDSANRLYRLKNRFM